MSNREMRSSKLTFCPICGRKFNPAAAWKHINEYHPSATESQLRLIRDIKREKIPFATKPLNKNTNIIISSPYRPDGVMYSGGIPSLGKKK